MNKKKLYIILLFGLLSLFFSGCQSSNTPSTTVENFLESFKNCNFEKMKTVLDSDEVPEYLNGEIKWDELLTDFDIETDLIDEECNKRLYDFDYKITDEVISSDNKIAKVTVSITRYNIGEMIVEQLPSGVKDVLKSMIKGSKKTIDESMAEILLDSICESTKCITESVTFDLTNTDDSWLINMDKYLENKDLQNALTSGLYIPLNNLEDILDDAIADLAVENPMLLGLLGLNADNMTDEDTIEEETTSDEDITDNKNTSNNGASDDSSMQNDSIQKIKTRSEADDCVGYFIAEEAWTYDQDYYLEGEGLGYSPEKNVYSWDYVICNEDGEYVYEVVVTEEGNVYSNYNNGWDIEFNVFE